MAGIAFHLRKADSNLTCWCSSSLPEVSVLIKPRGEIVRRLTPSTLFHTLA